MGYRTVIFRKFIGVPAFVDGLCPEDRIVGELLYFSDGNEDFRLLFTKEIFAFFCRYHNILHEDEYMKGEFDEEAKAA